jgi:radical SAM protein with 4Fe4S-binding SPASM domain
MPALIDRLVERSFAENIPLSVQIDLTMRCNERCVHCYRVIEDRRELTTDEVRSVLGDLARAGTLYLTFSGGEVFLRRDLFDLIAHAKHLAFDVRLKSNALLVTEERARRLRALGVRQVDVSVYSTDPALHDAVTKVRGSLDRTIAGIVHLRDAGLRVKLNCPLMTSTVGGYRDVRALADRLGIAHGFDPMITTKNDGDRAPVRLRLGARELQAVLADPAMGPAASSARPVGAPRGDLDEVPCGASHNAGYISAYGDVMPCVALPVACGNVREESFASIWLRSPAMREVRAIRIRSLHTCSGCEAAEFCSRCPGQALIEDGDLYGPSRAACEHALVSARFVGSTAIPATMRGRERDGGSEERRASSVPER